MSTVSIKLHVAKEVRRFAIARNFAFADFHTFVCQKLVPSFKEHQPLLHYTYVDDEEDTIKITMEEEWKEALNYADRQDGYLALRLTRQATPAKPAPQQHPYYQQQQYHPYHQQRATGYAPYNACPRRFAHCAQQQACPRFAQQHQQKAQCSNPWFKILQTIVKDALHHQEKEQDKKQDNNCDLESVLNDMFGKEPSAPAKQATEPASTANKTCTPVQVPEEQPMVAEQVEQEQAKQEPTSNNTAKPEKDYSLELNALQSMGFNNAKFNEHLLRNFDGYMTKVIDALLTVKLD